MEKWQRKALLRVASAYQIASSEALSIIMGTPPTDLLMNMRTRIYRSSRGKMQNDRKLTGEMAKCDGWGLDEEIDPYGAGLDRERGRRDRPICHPTFNGPRLLRDVLKKNRENSGRGMQVL